MKVITAKVIDGKIAIPHELVDGTNVAILAPDAEGFRLTEDQEAELSAALAEIQTGSSEDGAELLAELRALRPS